MKSVLRAILRIVGVASGVLLLLTCLGVGLLWLTLPASSVSLAVPGLRAPVEIAYDSDGIPHIRASSSLDAAAALGFVHARDRMFQMELMRRSASGRLSEIAGPQTLAMDRLMRTLGLRQHAVADYAALPEDTRAVLQAYASGVNAWIARKGRFVAPEFLPLGAPEAWEPVDSLLWAKTMGLWLSMNWRQEIARLGLQGKLSPAMLNELWPPHGGVPGPDAMLDRPSRQADAAQRLLGELPDFPAAFTQPHSASNEWAVDGRHTATGAPLLAGDPHLGFSFPGIWYLARIDTPDGTLAGGTAPGVPFLVLGHNGKVAWTFTTTGADVQDIFVETSVGNAAYQTPDGPQPYALREETIRVRGQPDQMMIVRETRHGPVISDLDNPSGPVMAVAMGNLQPGDTAAAGLLALNRATSVQEAGRAAAMISSPVQNLLVADAKTIGLFVTGRVPLRKAGDGSVPVPGDGSHDWTGWASGDQLPHSVAPASGRLVNANEPVWPPDFPVFMGRDTFGDWRASRIREMLEQSDRHTVAGFARMQTDAVDGFARKVLPTLLAVPDLEPIAHGILTGWDGTAAMDSPAPLIFVAWMDNFRDAVLAHAGATRSMGAPLADFVSMLLTPTGRHWCAGDCRPVLRASLRDAIRNLGARYGGDAATWRWGNAHEAVFAHPILRYVPVIGPLTTISVPMAGDDNTVGRGGTNGSFQSVHGAAYRGVYDLSNLDNSAFMIAPGQSGNPVAGHARDLLTRWRDGATVTLGSAVSARSGTALLTP